MQVVGGVKGAGSASTAAPPVAVSATTRAMRRLRAEQLAEVHCVLDTGTWYRSGHRSPAAWLCAATGESYGQCTLTLHLAKTIVSMPLVRATFATGDLAESALRLLADTWSPPVADVFARDEAMLLGWATTLPVRDLKMLLDTWRMHADPDREERTAQERFDQRAVHLSQLLDGVGRLDGTLDPEGYQLVHEAIRALAQPADDETRTAAQRRHDALVQMAKLALDNLEPQPGKRRQSRPTVIATATVHDLVDSSGGGSIDTGGHREVVPIDTVRRLACDCDLHRYLAEPSGHVVDYGRRRRLVSDAQFDLLIIRDHGCRWPGCAIPAAGCDAHHADHWLDDGETEPDNLVLLCWYHHHLLHEQHWRIEPLGAGHFTLHTPDGTERRMRPPLIGANLPTQPPLEAAW